MIYMATWKKTRWIFLSAGVVLSLIGLSVEIFMDIPTARTLSLAGTLALWVGYYMPCLQRSKNKRKPMWGWIGNLAALVCILLGGYFAWCENFTAANTLWIAGPIVAIVTWLATRWNEPVV